MADVHEGTVVEICCLDGCKGVLIGLAAPGEAKCDTCQVVALYDVLGYGKRVKPGTIRIVPKDTDLERQWCGWGSKVAEKEETKMSNRIKVYRKGDVLQMDPGLAKAKEDVDALLKLKMEEGDWVEIRTPGGNPKGAYLVDYQQALKGLPYSVELNEARGLFLIRCLPELKEFSHDAKPSPEDERVLLERAVERFIKRRSKENLCAIIALLMRVCDQEHLELSQGTLEDAKSFIEMLERSETSQQDLYNARLSPEDELVLLDSTVGGFIKRRNKDNLRMVLAMLIRICGQEHLELSQDTLEDAKGFVEMLDRAEVPSTNS